MAGSRGRVSKVHKHVVAVSLAPCAMPLLHDATVYAPAGGDVVAAAGIVGATLFAGVAIASLVRGVGM